MNIWPDMNFHTTWWRSGKVNVHLVISFVAVGQTAKCKHDHSHYGDKPCALYPYCSNVFRGGEDIGLVKIISPEFHANAEEDSWACWYHCQASLDGIEVQNQAKHDVKVTPKPTKPKKASSAAPVKKPLANQTTKKKANHEGSPDAKAKLEDKLDLGNK